MSDEEIQIFIKDTGLENPTLITLVTSTSVRLREEGLSDANQLNVVLETIHITSRNFYNLASKPKTLFIQKDKKLFYQNLMVLTIILRTAFPLFWFQNKPVINWSNSFNQNKYAYNNLLYKAIRVVMLDLGLELIKLYEQLDSIIIEEPSDWIFFIRMASRSLDFFLFKICQIEKIVFAGLEQPIEEDEVYKQYNSSKYTEKVLRINELRRETLVKFYQKTFEAGFEDNFFLVAGDLLDVETIENIRNLADLRPLADKSELNSNLL